MPTRPYSQDQTVSPTGERSNYTTGSSFDLGEIAEGGGEQIKPWR